MKALTYPRLFLLLAIVLFSCIPIVGQIKNVKLLSDIPPTLRERLVRRLELFIAYDRSHQYDKQFDLLSRRYFGGNHLDRSAYIQDRQTDNRGTFLEMEIYAVQPHVEKKYVEIQASIKSRYGVKTRHFDWNFVCDLQDGEWYFHYFKLDYWQRAQQIVAREPRERVSQDAFSVQCGRYARPRQLNRYRDFAFWKL
jgi:hypothetical protein